MVSMSVSYVHAAQPAVLPFGGIQRSLLALLHYCKLIGLLQILETIRKEQGLKSLMMLSVFIDVMG